MCVCLGSSYLTPYALYYNTASHTISWSSNTISIIIIILYAIDKISLTSYHHKVSNPSYASLFSLIATHKFAEAYDMVQLVYFSLLLDVGLPYFLPQISVSCSYYLSLSQHGFNIFCPMYRWPSHTSFSDSWLLFHIFVSAH